MQRFHFITDLHYSLNERGADVDVDFQVECIAEQTDDLSVKVTSVIQDQDGERVELLGLLTDKQQRAVQLAADTKAFDNACDRAWRR
jgi:hypothetical protein